jgi:hypothetical protein
MLYKNVDGKQVALTQKEEDDLRALWAAEEIRSAKIKYIHDRQLAYPNIPDQLDMLFKDQMNGTTTWRDAITAVKNKYPKPTE